MISHHEAFDEYVIYVDLYCFANKVGKIVDKLSIGSPSIFQLKGHLLVAIKSSNSDEICTFLISRVHENLIITQVGIHEA